jgi:outer membrane protein assembly factor BamA
MIVIATLAVIMASCSTTRRIDDDDQLYTGIKQLKITADSVDRHIPDGLREAINEAVDVAPNNYWKLIGWRYPFPLGLWVYNNWSNPEKGFKHWLYEKLVEEPVLVSDVRPEVRTRMIKEIIDNQGYFSGTATYQLVPGKNPKKASVIYNVNVGRAYRFNSIELLPDTSRLCHFVDSLARREKYLRVGERYSTDSLSDVRINIANSMRNRGYYFFRPEFIEYLADSVSHPGMIDLRMTLASDIEPALLKPYKTGDVTVVVNRYRGRSYPDTIPLQNMTLIQMKPSRLRQEVISDNVTFKPGKTFSVRDMNRTQSYLSRLGIFSSISIEPKLDTIKRDDRLNVLVECKLDQPLEASVELNASSKSNSYIGPGITLGVNNTNVFGGGEQFGVSLGGSYEWQTGGGNKGGIFNSYEVSLTTSLSFPRLLAPKFIPRRRRQLNWTRFSLNGDMLNRPHFFKMAQFNASMAYEWNVTRHVTSSFTPLKLTYTKLINTTHDFDSIMAANPAVALSFQNQFIPQMMYNYTYDRTFKNGNTLNIQLGVQEAGNVFWAAYEACGSRGTKRLFGTPFSQFVKGTAQVVWGQKITANSTLVSRAAVGAAHAYGNSSEVPYAEQFYCGGANSVRAFTVRSLGPGSYRAPEDTASDYFDQTGTFKFEANVEYRFPLMGIIKGALFVDAGNVWLLKNDPQRPGGQLKASTFLKDLALGTGCGVRVDVSMLVVRLDLGIGLHAPYDTGKTGYYNLPSFKNSLAVHLALGYPF